MNQPLAHPQQAPRSLAQVIANLGPQSQLAATSTVDPGALAAGIKPSFATLTFKGKTWGIRHRGVTHQLLARDPNTGAILGSIPTVDVVILKSAMAISKSYYIEKYKEGDFNQPDCWSTNGIAPDMAAPKRQANTCRGCKWDAFGSRTMDDGRKGKACSDNKRLAVVPAADLKNELYGGPMLLKLPPSGFGGLSELEAQLHHAGYHYFAVVMRLSFDYTVAFPKIVFTPIAVLDDHAMTEVLELQKVEQVDRILSEELYEVSGDPEQPTPGQGQAQEPAQAPAAEPPHQQPAAPVVQPMQPTAFSPQPPPPQPQPQPQQQPAAPVSGFVAQPLTTAPDPGPMPPHLVRTQQGNGAAQPQQPAPQPMQQQPPAAETPEQKIARLEAQLAEANKPKTRKRTAPVTPAGNQQQQPPQGVQPLQGVPLPLPTTAPTQPNGGGVSNAERRIAQEMEGSAGTSIVPPDDDEGEGSADLDSRIDALLKPPTA